jgi:hypothetical protein
MRGDSRCSRDRRCINSAKARRFLDTTAIFSVAVHYPSPQSRLLQARSVPAAIGFRARARFQKFHSRMRRPFETNFRGLNYHDARLLSKPLPPRLRRSNASGPFSCRRSRRLRHWNWLRGKRLIAGLGHIGGTYVAPIRRRSSDYRRRVRVRLWRPVRLRGEVHDLATPPANVQAPARLLSRPRRAVRRGTPKADDIDSVPLQAAQSGKQLYRGDRQHQTGYSVEFDDGKARSSSDTDVMFSIGEAARR